jgi:hypothetical protein
MSWRFCASSGIVFFRPIISFIISFGILSTHDIPHDMRGAPISSAVNLLLSALLHLRTPDPCNTILFIVLLYMYIYIYVCIHFLGYFLVPPYSMPSFYCISLLSSSFGNFFHLVHLFLSTSLSIFIVITYCKCLIVS